MARLMALVAATYGCVALVHRTPWYHQRLYQELLTAPLVTKEGSARALAHLGGEGLLLEALRKPESSIRKAAEDALDAHWFAAAGLEPARKLLTAEIAMNDNRYDEALAILDRLVAQYPDYAEALNRRASLLFRMGRVGASLRDCEHVLRLNPNHYGAWHGLGLCNLQLGNSDAARKCLERYQRLQPFDSTIEQWLHRCDELQQSDLISKPRPPIEPLI